MDPELIAQLSDVALTALMTVVTAVGAAVGRWLNEKAKSDAAQSVLGYVSKAAEEAVGSLEHTLRKKLKEAHEDGHLSDDDIRSLRDEAVSSVSRQLGTKGLAQLRAVVGESVDEVIKTKVEHAVGKRKRS